MTGETMERDCSRCYDSGRVNRHYGMGVTKIEPCPACTLEGMKLHSVLRWPRELGGGPYEGWDPQEALYAAGEPKPLTRRIAEFFGLANARPPTGGRR